MFKDAIDLDITDLIVLHRGPPSLPCNLAINTAIKVVRGWRAVVRLLEESLAKVLLDGIHNECVAIPFRRTKRPVLVYFE